MTSKSISIQYNESGMRQIMKGQGITNMEQDIMMQKLGEIKAAFLHDFGFEGSFILKTVDTKSKRARMTVRICANNARTASMLKKNSGWLKKFLV